MAPFWHQHKSFWLTLEYQQLIGGAMTCGDPNTRRHQTPARHPELKGHGADPGVYRVHAQGSLRDDGIVSRDPKRACWLVATAFS
jgi:hypothetical protein